MRRLFFTFFLSTAATFSSFAQVDTTKSISEQIMTERDNLLNVLSDSLKKNEDEIQKLTNRLLTDRIQDREKIAALEKLQLALDKRTKTLEEAPKTRVKYNGQLAFTELLSLQRDLQPARLFSNSQSFFTQIGSISNLQKYASFSSWKTEYDNWYQSQKKSDQMLQLLNGSIGLISDVSNKIPLYGSIVQTVSSGISSAITNFGGKFQNLKDKTPSMLKLLNAVSQFENQKAIIDHEWEQINKELNQLQIENELLLKDQFKYYGINYDDYKSNYLDATLDSDRDKFKNECRITINEKLNALDNDPNTKRKWLGQVEIYMYKVQSLRIRFGNLTNRMLTNMDKYENLIELFSDDTKFPRELTTSIKETGKSLNVVKKSISETFKPEKYIEDSAIMYIEKN